MGWSRQRPGSSSNQDDFLDWPERLVWAVADGVSHGVEGDMASSMVMQALATMGEHSTLDQMVEEAVSLLALVNDRLWKKREVNRFCATTFSLLLMHSGEAACLWAGDSRCYLFRERQLYQCTRDHTLRQEHIDSGILTAAEAGRMIRGHIITNSLGADKDFYYEKVFFDLRPGDKLTLCTDGLFNLLTPEIISRVLLESREPLQASGRFLELLERKGHSDDATQVTIFISALNGMDAHGFKEDLSW